MSDTAPAPGTSASGLAGVIERILAALDRIPYWLIALAARVFPAAIFWQSGQTKVSGLHLKPSAIALFANEYQLPIIDPTAAAYLSAFSEHLLPHCSCSGLRHALPLSACCS
jgi:putative oxidoreductase